MATSQNGWSVRPDASDLTPLPWVSGRVHPATLPIFNYLCEQFAKRVEPIRKDHSWGYAYRPVRGKSSGFSNHASGTAIDLNAPAHPLGARDTFSKPQRDAIKQILRELGGVVRWGGDYSGRKDEMHFEIVGTRGEVGVVATRIGSGSAPTTPLTPTQPETQEDDMTPEERDTLNRVDQRLLTLMGPIEDIHKWVRGVATAMPTVQRWIGYLMPAATKQTEGIAALREQVEQLAATATDDAARQKLEQIKALLS